MNLDLDPFEHSCPSPIEEYNHLHIYESIACQQLTFYVLVV